MLYTVIAKTLKMEPTINRTSLRQTDRMRFYSCDRSLSRSLCMKFWMSPCTNFPLGNASTSVVIALRHKCQSYTSKSVLESSVFVKDKKTYVEWITLTIFVFNYESVILRVKIFFQSKIKDLRPCVLGWMGACVFLCACWSVCVCIT